MGGCYSAENTAVFRDEYLVFIKDGTDNKADKGQAGYKGVSSEEVLLANYRKLLVNS